MNLEKMMQKAQEMQKRMGEMQKTVEKTEIEGQSGGGIVRISLNGKGEMKKIQLDPSIVDPQEPEMLEDLIKAAFQDAKQKVDKYMQDEMGKITGGLPGGGFKLPF